MEFLREKHLKLRGELGVFDWEGLRTRSPEHSPLLMKIHRGRSISRTAIRGPFKSVMSTSAKEGAFPRPRIIAPLRQRRKS